MSRGRAPADEAAWGGLDTLHILAGVPSTSTLMQLAGVQLEPASGAQSKKNPSQRFVFTSEQGQLGEAGPGEEGLERLAAEARACAEVNYVGTVLALGAFVSDAIRLPNRQDHTVDILGSPLGLLVSLASAASSLLGSSHDPCTLSRHLFCHEGCWAHGHGEL